MDASRSFPSRTLVAWSAVGHVAVLLLLFFFRNLGWETRAWFGRLSTTDGVVVASTYCDTLCTKAGGCRPLYETRVDFHDDGGGSHTFVTHWVAEYAPGARVPVEYSRGRPSLARIRLTSDVENTFLGLLSFAAGLGLPLLVGALVVSVCELRRAAFRHVGLPVVLRGLSYLAVNLLALAANAVLAAFLYWV